MSDGEREPRTERPGETPSRKRRGVLVALPLLVFAGLAGVFFYQITSGKDPTEIASVLIGTQAPATELPPLPGLEEGNGAPVPGIDLAVRGTQDPPRPTLVNVFASWCAPCRQEHPFLMRLAESDRLEIVGINYKDREGNALDFLRELGNPYDAVGVDRRGQATIDWGVYGVPESFLVAPDGTIVFKQTGPFSRENIEDGLIPALEKIERGSDMASGTPAGDDPEGATTAAEGAPATGTPGTTG